MDIDNAIILFALVTGMVVLIGAPSYFGYSYFIEKHTVCDGILTEHEITTDILMQERFPEVPLNYITLNQKIALYNHAHCLTED